DFVIPQFELDVFVDVNDKEKASKWFVTFQFWSKTMMLETKRYEIKGKYVLFCETRHCIHSDTVKKKQGSREVKRQNLLRLRNTSCKATIHLRLESWRVELNHLLEVNIKFTHNHVINSAESLSFRRVNEKFCEKFLQLFKDGYSPASAINVHEDELYLSSMDEQDLLVLLADRANNPDYDYIAKLFQKYRETSLGDCNGSLIFRCLVDIVNEYNSSGRGKAILQEYDSRTEKALILCVVTGLMSRVHEKIPQSGEICYVDVSASFEPLNTSITLLCTSCAVGALPLGLFIISDELEITLEKALNLLKSILPHRSNRCHCHKICLEFFWQIENYP
ncbi:15778_t:CDS:1, partial [Rhizophagus irregularis]